MRARPTVTDPSWVADFADHCAPASSPAARQGWQRDLADFNEELRSRFALQAGERRIFGWQVRKAVAAHFGLTQAEIAGASRRAPYVGARQIAMYLCVRFAGLTSRQTGALFGGRDRSTVRYAVGCVAARVAADPKLAREIDALAAACRDVTDRSEPGTRQPPGDATARPTTRTRIA